MITIYGALLILGLIAVSFLIFFNNWLPNWACNYLGHHRPKTIYISSDSGSVRFGKCPRCGKEVQNDIDYANNIWY